MTPAGSAVPERAAVAPDRSLGRLALLAVTDGIGRVGALIAIIITTRWLGPTTYGVLAYGFSVGSIAAAVTEAGFTNHVMREAAARSSALHALLNAVVRLRLLLTGGAALAAGAAVQLAGGSPAVTLTTVLMTAALCLRWVSQSYVSALLGLGNARAGLTQQAVERLLMIAALPVMLGVFGPSPVAASAGFAVAAIGGWVCSAALWRRAGARDGDNQPTPLSQVLRSAWPLTVAGIAVTGFLFAGPLLLGVIAGDTDAGTYGGALNLYLPLVGIPALVMKAVIGELASDEPGPHASRALARLAFGAVALPGFLAIAAPEIVAVILGRGFAASGPVLVILAAGAAASWISSFYYYALLARRHERMYMVAVLAALVVSLALAPFLITAWGALGAAAALTAAELTSLGTAAWLARNNAHFRPGAFLRVMAVPAVKGAAAVLVAAGVVAAARGFGANSAIGLGAGLAALGLASLALARNVIAPPRAA